MLVCDRAALARSEGGKPQSAPERRRDVSRTGRFALTIRAIARHGSQPPERRSLRGFADPKPPPDPHPTAAVNTPKANNTPGKSSSPDHPGFRYPTRLPLIPPTVGGNYRVTNPNLGVQTTFTYTTSLSGDTCGVGLPSVTVIRLDVPGAKGNAASDRVPTENHG